MAYQFDFAAVLQHSDLLLQGAYQPVIDAAQLATFERWARARYVALLRERSR